MNLKNKRILMIAPSFFGYEIKIIQELERQGATVHFIRENVDASGFFQKIINKLPLRLQTRYREQYYLEQFERVKDIRFDLIFGIRLYSFNKTVLTALKSMQPSAYYIVYFWDSCRNMLNAQEVSTYFDRVLTFDRSDYLNHIDQGWIFRPLFYCPEFQLESSCETTIDLLYIATLFPLRADWYTQLQAYCSEKRLTLYTRLVTSRFHYWYKRLIAGAYRSLPSEVVLFKGMSTKEITEFMAQSRVMFDCTHSAQTGLPMRIIECLGMQKKLITTNTDIVNYDFYNSKNIFILREDNINGIDNFINGVKYTEISKDIYHRYSLEGWVNDIFQSGSHDSRTT